MSFSILVIILYYKLSSCVYHIVVTRFISSVYPALLHLNLHRFLFFVFVTCSDNPPGLVDIETLKAQNGDVPVMIATVDCGRVSFFRFDATELPLLP